MDISKLEHKRKKCFKIFRNFSKESIEDAVSDATVEYLSGKLDIKNFYMSVKNKLITAKSFLPLDDKIVAICENHQIEEFIEHDHFMYTKEIFYNHLNNNLGEKQQSAIVRYLNGEKNNGEPNFKQAVKKLRELMGGKTINHCHNLSWLRYKKVMGQDTRKGSKHNIHFVPEIRASDLPIWALAEKFGLSERTIRKIKNREVFKDI